jgi:hypothetical protein
MKKSQQTLILFFSIIILTFFAGHAYAQVCTASYFIDGIDTSGDIAALSGCTEITGSLHISYTALTNLSGLENITSVGGLLYITGNTALTTLSGLENIESVDGTLEIKDNTALTTLNGLENITSVGGSLYITGNTALTILSGLENITSVDGTLYITYNTALASLSGLENITSVSGTLVISDNAALASLSGLEGLTSVDGNLFITDNAALTNLCALYYLTLEGCELVITDNPMLSMDTAYALETQLRLFTWSCFSDWHPVISNNNGSEPVICDSECNLSIDADKTVFNVSGGEMIIDINSDCGCELSVISVWFSGPIWWIKIESSEFPLCPGTFSFSILENQGISSREGSISVGLVTEYNTRKYESFYIFQEGSPADIDIMPDDCPNVLNQKSKGVIPIVISGSEEIDVSAIDPESIRLMRTEDAGLYDVGVTPVDWSFEDVATKFQGELCDRVKLKNNGFTDLLLKFDNQEVFSSLGLDVYDGETMTFKITGNLYEEFGVATFTGSDTARITTDNCPDNCNIQQLDADGDGIGDVCDDTPGCGGCGQPDCETEC